MVEVLLQRFGAVAELVITEVGLTVAVTLKGVPAQPSTEGVTIYTTSMGSSVPLTRVSVMEAVAPLPVAGLMPVTSARVHANVAVALLLVAVYVVEVLLQRLGAVAELVITAVGLTVAVTLNGVPAQPSTEGVTT